MRITDLLKKSGIALGVKVADKSEAIDKLVSLHEKCGNLKDVKAYKEGILNREELGTTAVGMEVAIPHAKSEAVKAPALTAITVPDGVDYDSPDRKRRLSSLEHLQNRLCDDIRELLCLQSC